MAKTVVAGPDAEAYDRKIKEYAEAGFEYVCLCQIGPDQDGFFDFAKKELLPRYQ